MVLDRPRHEKLIAHIRAAGARIRLIGDGDLSAGIAAAVAAPACMRSWAPAALRKACSPPPPCAACTAKCSARLVVNKPELEERVQTMGIRTWSASTRSGPRARQRNHLRRLRRHRRRPAQRRPLLRRGVRTHSLVMTLSANKARFLDTVHLNKVPGRRGVRLY